MSVVSGAGYTQFQVLFVTGVRWTEGNEDDWIPGCFSDNLKKGGGEFIGSGEKKV